MRHDDGEEPTKREILAAVALHGMLSSNPPNSVNRLEAYESIWAAKAFAFADAMIAEANKRR